jgi:hypothetical protein
MIRSLRIATLAALVWGIGASAAWAHGGHKVVHFHGLSLRVPASWPVVDLGAHPATCVRFNRHAVYLGSPSAEQRCPAHQIGRTDAILVENPAQAARASGTALPGTDGRTAHVRVHGLRVTATWGGSSSTVAQALGLRRLEASASAAPRPAASASAVRRAHVSNVGTGLGFDPCATPSAATMSAWRSSPYHFVGVYLGGANMACSQPNLTISWVRSETAAGWRFIPTWVGRQAPTSSCGGCSTIQPGQAASEGAAEANAAIARAQAVGMGTGNPIYFDMEAYTPNSSATTMTRYFLAAWTKTLHAAGYLSGVYSSAASGIADLVAAYGTSYIEPDDIWIANWNGRHSTSDPYVPAGDWAAHQRLHQFNGGQNVTYGGVTLNIDGDWLDGAVAGYGTGVGAPLYPNGTVLQDTTTGSLYTVAGGAPLFVSDPATINFIDTAVPVSPSTLSAMNPVPTDKTFLVTNSGLIFRVAGGTAFPITSWSLFGGTRPSVLIDQWDITNLLDAASHLRSTPKNGTIVEGLPSKTFWKFSGGGRYQVPHSKWAISVDDTGLQGFAQVAGGSGLFGSPCVVPSLRRKTLSQARKLITRAHCRVGKIAKPRHVAPHHTLRVVRQLPKARSSKPANWKVFLRLG